MRNLNLRSTAKRSPGGFARRFGRHQGGNVALMFSALLVPICILVFGSIDFYRANNVKANLQDALDAAAIVAARTQSTDATVIRNAGMAALRASIHDYTDTTLIENPAYTDFRLVDGRIVATARTNVTPWVAGMFLQNGMRVSASAEVVRATSHLEVALVLDVTGSMNANGGGGQTKIQRLRAAATNFINTMEATAVRSGDPAAVRIAMVPFSQSVNILDIGASNSTWVQNADHTGTTAAQRLFTNNPSTNSVDESLVNRLTLFTGMGTAWGGCIESRLPPHDIQETAPTSAATRFPIYLAPDEPGAGDGYGTKNGQGQFTAYDAYFNDYLPDNLPNGNAPWNTDAGRQGYTGKYTRAPTYTSTMIADLGAQGPNFGCTQSRIMPLSTNWNNLRTRANGLTGVGSTNIPLGLMWGWHVLSPTPPFTTSTPGLPYTDRETTKVVVLMTDGDNTMLDFTASLGVSGFNRSIYNALGYIWQGRVRNAANAIMGTTNTEAQRTAAMDSRMTQLCTNMRNAGIIIYTVRVEVDTSSPDALRNCASRPEYFYDVTDASRLNDAFSAIAGSITQMRISR